MRIPIIRTIISILFIIIAIDLVYIQLIRGHFYHSLSTHNRIRVVPLEGKRGRIFDRNGVTLADNRVSFDVMVTPQEIKKRDDLFAFLSYVLETDRKKLLKRFYQKRFTPFAPVVVAQDVEYEKAFILKENEYRFPSLLVQRTYRRNYPYKSIGAHVLGYVGKINRSKVKKLKDYGYTAQSIIGYAGVEQFYDSYLKGERGGVQVEVNSRGQQVRLLGLKSPKEGQDIQLTIDHRIQLMAVDALNNKPGAIVVIDLENGDILGMASSPSYDPNLFVDVKDRNEVISLFSDPESPVMNRVIQGQFPPGSVFKIPVAFAALENKHIDPEETFSCPGYFRMGRRRIACAHTHGDQNIVEGIAHSCNVYFINTGLRVGSDLMAKYAELFGLGKLTNIDLPFEENGNIPSKKQRRAQFNRQWYKGDTANLSIGQGDVLTTPLQLARMISAVALDGKLIQPHVIKGKELKRIKKPFFFQNLRFDKETLSLVKEGLHNVVHDHGGTAHLLNIKGLSVSGKTGTAQSSPTKKHHAWFVGFTKDAKRNIAFCVLLEHGGSSYYATRVTRNFLLKLKKTGIL